MEIRSFYSNSRKNLYRADAAKRGGAFWDAFLSELLDFEPNIIKRFEYVRLDRLFDDLRTLPDEPERVFRAYLEAMEGRRALGSVSVRHTRLSTER